MHVGFNGWDLVSMRSHGWYALYIAHNSRILMSHFLTKDGPHIVLCFSQYKGGNQVLSQRVWPLVIMRERKTNKSFGQREKRERDMRDSTLLLHALCVVCLTVSLYISVWESTPKPMTLQFLKGAFLLLLLLVVAFLHSCYFHMLMVMHPSISVQLFESLLCLQWKKRELVFWVLLLLGWFC